MPLLRFVMARLSLAISPRSLMASPLAVALLGSSGTERLLSFPLLSVSHIVFIAVVAMWSCWAACISNWVILVSCCPMVFCILDVWVFIAFTVLVLTLFASDSFHAKSTTAVVTMPPMVVMVEVGCGLVKAITLL